MLSNSMKSKHYNIVARLSVCLTVVFSLFGPALAVENVSAGKPAAIKPPAFRLNAQVNQNPQLSRDEGDAIISHLAPAAPADGAGSLPQGFPRTMPAAPAPSNALLSGNVSANQQATLPPQAYLSEYGVDWSGWISQMAARWHYNLKRLEAQSNVCFVTERPALIQFTCASNGQVGNFFLKQSSGVYAYDQLQMLALSQVTPLPPFPKGTRCATITLVQGWESHTKKPGESGFDPSAFGRRFPMEKVQQWVRSN
jgi:hypothetical protein